MLSKQYHSKVPEEAEIEEYVIDEHLLTKQKESKYYSNNDDTAIKKRLLLNYDQAPSTNHSAQEGKSATLLNQLHDAIHSYRPLFSETSSKRKPNYTCTNLAAERVEQKPTNQQEASLQENAARLLLKFQQVQGIPTVPKRRISHIDKQISALYKENRNINLQYRKQKFMQLFLRPNEYYNCK